jgi:arginine decarboxylase
MTDWTPDKARQTYNIRQWSAGYFDVNEAGHLTVKASASQTSVATDLFALINAAAKDLTLPFLLRFSDILRDRVKTLCEAFTTAMQDDNYQGSYTAVYPIKVNQQRSVIEHIISDNQGNVGLEAGSKPELLAVMALHNHKQGIVVCNGYKDREYVRLALLGQRLDLRVYIVLEKLSELKLVLEESKKLGIKPLLGVRIRLASIGAGKWQNTGGEKAKFGVTAAQLLLCIEQLRAAGELDSLQMLHFHLGSQLPNIRDIQKGMAECARYFAELYKLGANIKCIDVGGGLGVDYEGTASRSFCSTNYSLEEYAHNVVHAFWRICEEHDLPHPDIVSESGRALTAHHAVLVTNVVETNRVTSQQEPQAPQVDAPVIMLDMWQRLQTLKGTPSKAELIELYHDVQQGLADAQTLYTNGVLSLEQRAYVENIYYICCVNIHNKLDPSAKQHRDLFDELNDKLADKYFCNLSVFQSIPDVWAIEQIFPIMPIHRLNEQPTRRGVIEDITCDSDGRIDHYVDNEGIESSLPLHEKQADQPYLLGIFLVGAYQEILGDMHNLFGDTDSVDVAINEDGSYVLSKAMHGDTVDSVLRHVHIDSSELLDLYKAKLARSVEDDSDRQAILNELEDGLHGYTYLEDE